MAKVNDISVLSLNVFHEGYTFSSLGINPEVGVGNTIIKSMADVVALPEVDDPKFLNDLLTYLNNADGDADIDFHGVMNGSTATISKYALLDSKANGDAGGTRSVVDLDGNGKVSAGDFVFDGIHANYTDYANYLPRGYYPGSETGPYAGKGWGEIGPDGKPLPVTDLDDISTVNKQSGRPDALQKVADEAKAEHPELTSIVAGDFNEASHLDWTEDAKNLFDHNGVVYEWDTSKVLADAGYIDSFRKAHPDEVKNPGFTWVTPVETGDYQVTWTPGADERDRIDFIYHRAGGEQQVKIVSSGLFGNDDYVVRDQFTDHGSGEDTSLNIGEPWFTDHNGVLTRYQITTPTQETGPKPGSLVSGTWKADVLKGTAGDDIQIGLLGDDRFLASKGGDLLIGGFGHNTADYSAAKDNVWVALDGSRGSGDLADGDRLIGIEDVIGGQRHDRIAGDYGANKLTGGAGNDQLAGLGGNDTLDGGADDDKLDGGDGKDTLLGGTGHDWLSGGKGDDTLTAGTGIDVMWGGAGKDVFRFVGLGDSTRLGRDSIMDFSSAQHDKLDLSAIDASTLSRGNQAFAFIGDAAFTQKAGQLHTVAEADSLRVEGDVNGDGSADFSILLSSLAAINANSFLL